MENSAKKQEQNSKSKSHEIHTHTHTHTHMHTHKIHKKAQEQKPLETKGKTKNNTHTHTHTNTHTHTHTHTHTDTHKRSVEGLLCVYLDYFGMFLCMSLLTSVKLVLMVLMSSGYAFVTHVKLVSIAFYCVHAFDYKCKTGLEKLIKNI